MMVVARTQYYDKPSCYDFVCPTLYVAYPFDPYHLPVGRGEDCKNPAPLPFCGLGGSAGFADIAVIKRRRFSVEPDLVAGYNVPFPGILVVLGRAL